MGKPELHHRRRCGKMEKLVAPGLSKKSSHTAEKVTNFWLFPAVTLDFRKSTPLQQFEGEQASSTEGW